MLSKQGTKIPPNRNRDRILVNMWDLPGTMAEIDARPARHVRPKPGEIDRARFPVSRIEPPAGERGRWGGRTQSAPLWERRAGVLPGQCGGKIIERPDFGGNLGIGTKTERPN